MTKQLPNLQVALDHSDLKGAIAAAVRLAMKLTLLRLGQYVFCKSAAS